HLGDSRRGHRHDRCGRLRTLSRPGRDPAAPAEARAALRPRRERPDRRREDEGSDVAYVRLRVANRGGRDTADDVVVMATAPRQWGDAETRPIGLPLAWSGSRPPLTVASVHPGSERHVDLLHFSESEPVHIAHAPKPTGGRGALEAG